MNWFSIAIRWLFGIGLLGLGISLITGELAASPAPPVEAFEPEALRPPLRIGRILLGMGSIIAGATMLAPDLVRLAASPAIALVESIVCPRDYSGKPPLELRLPIFYREQERYEDALEEYRKMMRHHPGRPEGWIGAIELLVEEFEDPEEAARLYTQGKRKLRGQAEALTDLEAAWHRLGAPGIPR